MFERLVDMICDKMSESLDSDPALGAKAGHVQYTNLAIERKVPLLSLVIFFWGGEGVGVHQRWNFSWAELVLVSYRYI